MPDRDKPERDNQLYAAVRPDLTELCRNHDVSLDLIECSDDVDELLDRVLSEFETRLEAVSIDSLAAETGPASVVEAQRLRALVMFASQAAALKEKAVAASELRRRAAQLEAMNGNLERALADEGRMRQRLDDVLAAVDAGILVAGADGKIEHANRAASVLTGSAAEQLLGRPSEPFLAGVGRNQDGEVVQDAGGEQHSVMLVARRDLPSEPRAEVVMLSDVTDRDRLVQERHQIEKLAEVMKTLAVLSHKINNPLTSLMGRAQILQMKKGTDPNVCKAAQVIEESARRIADYIRELAIVVKEGRTEALERVLNPESQPPALGKTER